MRVLHITIIVGAAMLSVAGPVTARAQRAATPTARQAALPASVTDSGYSSKESDFVVGKRVYLRSSKTFIGTIIDMEERHHFPPERFPRAEMKAVLLVRRDGPHDWVPVEGLTKIYVAR